MAKENTDIFNDILNNDETQKVLDCIAKDIEIYLCDCEKLEDIADELERCL